MEIPEAAPFKSISNRRIIECIGRGRVAQSRAQSSQREVRTLREKHHLLGMRRLDQAVPSGPKPCDRAEERALTCSRSSYDQDAFARTDLSRGFLDEGASIVERNG